MKFVILISCGYFFRKNFVWINLHNIFYIRHLDSFLLPTTANRRSLYHNVITLDMFTVILLRFDLVLMCPVDIHCIWSLIIKRSRRHVCYLKRAVLAWLTIVSETRKASHHILLQFYYTDYAFIACAMRHVRSSTYLSIIIGVTD